MPHKPEVEPRSFLETAKIQYPVPTDRYLEVNELGGLTFYLWLKEPELYRILIVCLTQPWPRLQDN